MCVCVCVRVRVCVCASPHDTKRSLVRQLCLHVSKVVEERLILLPHERGSLEALQDGVLLRLLEESLQTLLQHDVHLVGRVV